MNSFHPRSVFVVFLLLLSTLRAVAQEEPQEWTYISFRNFEIYSHVSEKKTLKLAKSLKVYLDGIGMAMPFIEDSANGKFKILVLKDEKEFYRYIPSGSITPNTRSGYMEVAGYRMICLNGDIKEKEAIDTLYGILSKVFLTNKGDYSRWFIDGMTEILSTFKSTGYKKISVGMNLPYHQSWFKSDAFRTFEQSSEGILNVRNSPPGYPNSEERNVYQTQCYQLCHYFVFNDDRELLPKFIRFAERSMLDDQTEALLSQELGLTYQVLDSRISRYKTMPYFTYKYEAGFSDIASKHPAPLDLQRTLFLGERISESYGMMGIRQLDLMQQYPNDPIVLEISTLYYDAVGEEDQFTEYLVKAIDAGSPNPYLKLYYGKYLVDEAVKEYGRHDVPANIIQKAISYINPIFEEDRNNILGAVLYLYAWIESRDLANDSLNPFLEEAYNRHKDSASVLLNLAAIYNRRQDADGLSKVLTPLKTMRLGDEQQEKVDWFQEQLATY